MIVTINDFIQQVQSLIGWDSVVIHGQSCNLGEHDQPLARDVLVLLRRWPQECDITATPRLACGCFDMVELKLGVLPLRKHLGMGNS